MKRITLCAAVSALALGAVAQPTVQVVFDQPDILAFGPPISDGDAGWMATDKSVTPNRVFFWNGGDTDDGDGDAMVRFTPSAPPGVTFFGTGNDAEAAIATVGGSVTNSPIRGIAVSPTNGNAFAVIDPNGDGAAYLVRFNGSAVEVIAGGNDATSPVDGTVDVECIGTTVYLLQRAAVGAALDQIVSFDGTAAAGIAQAPTLVKDLSAAFGATQAPSGMCANNSGDLLVIDSGSAGVSDSIGLVDLPGAAFSILKAGSAIVTEVGNGYTDLGYATGGVEVDPLNGDVYLQVEGTFSTGGATTDDFLVRVANGSGAAGIHITMAEVAAQITMGDDLYFNNNFSLAFYNTGVAAGNWLYISNDNSAGDGIFRVATPTTASVSDWAMY